MSEPLTTENGILIPPHLAAEFEQFRLKKLMPVENQSQQAAGTFNAEGDFMPMGTSDVKQWINFSTNNPFVADYRNKGISDQVLMGLFRQSIVGNMFYNTKFVNACDSYYVKHKDEIEERLRIEKEMIANPKKKEELLGSEIQSTPVIQTIKLSDGITFNKEDFENILGNELKLKSRKRIIKLNKAQIKELQDQL